MYSSQTKPSIRVASSNIGQGIKNSVVRNVGQPIVKPVLMNR